MTKWDKEYIKLCKTILKDGKEVENRTGVNTIKIPSYHLHFDLREEFPVLATKQLFFRQAILEMLWIYQAQSNDVRWLQERKVMTLWQNDYLDTAVLPSCVWSSEWDVTDGYLNLWVHQRSCDVPLGLPFNVTQYATLLSLIAKVTGLKPGTIDWSIKDAHIYVNQVEGIKEQINRFDTQEDIPAPKLWINPDIDDFFKFDNSKDCLDIKVVDYKHMGPIRFPLAQ